MMPHNPSQPPEAQEGTTADTPRCNADATFDGYYPETACKSTAAYLTVLTTDTSCNKQVRLDGDTPVKTSRGAGSRQMGVTHRVDTLEDLAALLRAISESENQCLVQGFVPGTEDGAAYQILSMKAVQRVHPGYESGWVEVDGVPTITRTKKNFSPSKWMQLDRDYAPGLPEEWATMTDEQWLAAINSFSPGVASMGYVRVASTSGRVLLDGVPLDNSGARFWFEVRDPTDYFPYGQRMKMAAAAAGYGYMKPFKGNMRGVLWSLFDPTVFSWERLVYDGKPKISGDRLSIQAADITLHPGGTVDTHQCVMLKPAQADVVEGAFHVKLGPNGAAEPAISDGYLTLQTKVETRDYGKITVLDFADMQENKVTCQATFRESDSWNGFLSRRGNSIFLYDNGTHTKYPLSKDAALALEMRQLAPLALAPAAFPTTKAAPVAPPVAPPVTTATTPRDFRHLNKGDLPDCELGEKGPAKKQVFTTANLEWLLACWDIECCFNVMTGRVEMLPPPGVEISEERLLGRIIDEVSLLGMPYGRVEVELENICMKDKYMPMEEWLKDLTWDGVDRIAQLEETIVTDTKAWPAYLRRWLLQVMAGVRGWRRGGLQLPHVLVLSGAHGSGKSTWFANLLPPAYFKGEASLHLSGGDSKDYKLAALRTVVTELAEIETTFSKSALGSLKSFISTSEDEIRRPYAKKAMITPRFTSFCGSVNSAKFLVDTTGNRRFWPVEVKAIRRDKIDIGQLWAQVATLDESFYLTEEEQLLHDQASEDHRSVSFVEDVFLDYFEPLTVTDKADWLPVTTVEVFKVLGLKNTHDPRVKHEIGELVLKHFGKPRRMQGKRKVRLMPVKVHDRVHVAINKPKHP